MDVPARARPWPDRCPGHGNRSLCCLHLPMATADDQSCSRGCDSGALPDEHFKHSSKRRFLALDDVVKAELVGIAGDLGFRVSVGILVEFLAVGGATDRLAAAWPGIRRGFG